MTVDFHTHTFPEKIALPALKQMSGQAHIPYFLGGTDSDLVRSDRDTGIDYSVVLPVVTNPLKTRSINDSAIALNGKNGLIYFGGIHPDTENPSDEIDRLKAAGIKGIKIHPVYQHTDVNDIRYLRIFDKAARENMIVVTHSGFDVGFPGADNCSPKMLRDVLDKVGNFTFVCAHMGGWKQWEKALYYLADTCTYIDTAVSLGTMTSLGDYYSAEERKLINRELFAEYVSAFGAGRILYGSDSPWSDRVKCIQFIRSSALSAGEINMILGENALKLLSIQA